MNNFSIFNFPLYRISFYLESLLIAEHFLYKNIFDLIYLFRFLKTSVSAFLKYTKHIIWYLFKQTKLTQEVTFYIELHVYLAVVESCE